MDYGAMKSVKNGIFILRKLSVSFRQKNYLKKLSVKFELSRKKF